MNITISQILQQAKYNCNDEVVLQAAVKRPNLFTIFSYQNLI